MDFFERFKQAEYEFTYGALDDPENHNALQVGLVAYFYIDKGYLPEKRQALIAALELYHQKFGDRLKWSFFKDLNKPDRYSENVLKRYQKKIIDSDGDHVDCWCASEEGFEYASDYCVQMLSSADWFEYVHFPVTYFSFYLPVSELKYNEDIENFLVEFCDILKPLHGLMGLGIQQCQERDKFQHMEYEVCQDFLGLDITNDNTDEHFRKGIRSVNWYTFFNDHWLDKLGGFAFLQSSINESRIKINKYNGGVIIRAGEWPELGWIKDMPYPELYLKVNKALKPIRAPEIGSLGYGSIAGEIRFDESSTAKWLSRFDVDLPSITIAPPVDNPVRITRWTDEIAPYAGQWASIVNGTTEYIQTREGQKMPAFEDKYGKKHRACWSLLKRDDKGSVFIIPD